MRRLTNFVGGESLVPTSGQYAQLVAPVTDDAQALAWANGLEYGLASLAWTSNHSRATRITRDLDYGCAWVNTYVPLVAEMPYGGIQRSDYGKDLSVYGFEDYTRVTHVMRNIEF